MDFVVGLPKTMGKYDSIWVIVDRLTKSSHFISVMVTFNAEKLAKLYVSRIVRLHRVPLSIISDRGTLFTFKFWKTLHAELGTRLDLSTAFHPQTRWLVRANDPCVRRYASCMCDRIRWSLG